MFLKVKECLNVSDYIQCLECHHECFKFLLLLLLGCWRRSAVSQLTYVTPLLLINFNSNSVEVEV